MSDSLKTVYARLAPDTQALLHAAALHKHPGLPRSALHSVMREAAGWNAATVDGHLDICREQRLIEGRDDLSLPPDVAAAVLETPPPLGAKATAIREAVYRRFISAAEGEGDIALPLFTADPAHWKAAGVLQPADAYTVGLALLDLDQSAAALPWFQIAVTDAEQGDEQGRVDHQYRGASLHEAGCCHVRQGLVEQSIPWFRRAVAAKEQGDIDGRVNRHSLGASLHHLGCALSRQHLYDQALPWLRRAVDTITPDDAGEELDEVDYEILGGSLHETGHCLSRLGKDGEALPWFQRAAEAGGRGDPRGLVDHESLARSLHQAGRCLYNQELYEQAFPWFQRAAEASERGDTQGLVDHESLGRSLEHAGHCLYRQELYEQALPWFERALKAAEQGDGNGLADQYTLCNSLFHVGDCLASLGRHERAVPFLQRAITELKHSDLDDQEYKENINVALRIGAFSLRHLGRKAEARAWEKWAHAPAPPKTSERNRID
ncbi:MAG: tetratricopeptide repeat protein [Azospirillaceae bacterium]|nr:tetratricopeptide repeat protein [Azospirillaceae bacterium]